MRTPFIVFISLMVLICAAAPLAGMHAQSPPPAKEARAPQLDPSRQQEKEPDPFRAQREKAMNKRRQENLKKDTDKLLELATELKVYVDKSNEHTLSLEVVRKAEAIEKLARSVREKMKGM